MNSWLLRLRISTRLWAMLGLAALLIAAAIVWLSSEKRTALMEEKRTATRHIVEAAIGALGQLEAAVKAGKISRELAQTMAVTAIKGMRYEGEEYLWINDMTPVMIMHPAKPELDGKNLAEIRDPTGKALFTVMVESVRAKGAGFVDYMWPKPGASAPQPKISYVKGFEPWGWIVGSGIYVDDVESAFWSGIRWTALALVIGGLVYFYGFLLLLRGISRPLGSAVKFAEAVADGDLTHTIEVQSADEVGQLLGALRQMNDHLNGMMLSIRDTSQAVASASAQISAGNADLSKRTEAQAASLEQTAASMEELTATVRQNAESANRANQLAASASEVAEQGGSVVREVVATMQSISSSSRKIGDIIGVIDGIAFQTNILALNAAVEAARAGEQGRGFAVVASEVRSLAQRSASAAKEIKDLITNSVGEIDSGVKLVGAAGKTIDDTVMAVKRVTEIMAEISAASQQQSEGITQVSAAVTHMDQATQQNAELVEETRIAAAGLEDQAHELEREVAVFRLRGSAPASHGANQGLPRKTVAALAGPARRPALAAKK